MAGRRIWTRELRITSPAPTTKPRSLPYILSSHAFCRLYLLFFGNCFLQEGTTKLIYAFHPDDPSSEDNIPPHDFESRGARSALLLNTLDDIPKLPDDTKTFNFTANKVKLKKTASRFLDSCWEKYFEYRTSKLIFVATQQKEYRKELLKHQWRAWENQKCLGKMTCWRVLLSSIDYLGFSQTFWVFQYMGKMILNCYRK